MLLVKRKEGFTLHSKKLGFLWSSIL